MIPGSSTAQAVLLRDAKMTLSQEDITACREAFDKFDKDGSGTVRVARARPATASQSARCEPFLVPGVPSLAFSTPRLTPSRTPQIDASELKATLNAMGQNPTEEEIFQMISQVDDDNSGEIEFAEFMKVIENQKASRRQGERRDGHHRGVRGAGGNADKTGNLHGKAEGRGEGARAMTRRGERRVSHPRARKWLPFPPSLTPPPFPRRISGSPSTSTS